MLVHSRNALEAEKGSCLARVPASLCVSVYAPVFVMLFCHYGACWLFQFSVYDCVQTLSVCCLLFMSQYSIVTYSVV